MNGIMVKLPTPLRGFVGGHDSVTVAGATAGEVLRGLAAGAEGLSDRLFTPDGELRRFVNVYLGRQDIRRLQGLETPVPAGTTLSVMVALAGG
jgi:molybdopterin converting factor small subunit